MNKQWDALWYNGCVYTAEATSTLIEHGAVAAKNGKIAWVGNMRDLPGNAEQLADTHFDLQGRLLTPGLIDCHTHLIYAGNRAHEFELRLQGVSYTEIARRGGGIQATVNATRAASEEELFAQSLKRAQVMLRNGVTTLEIKSGYGLDWETEYKMLRVAGRLEEKLGIKICKSFLGAHKVPAEYANKPDDYVDLICNTMLPAVAEQKLADAVDVFCENIAFDVQQTGRIFKAAKAVGLSVKCHAEQLSDSGAAKLAAQYQALSVDHLEYLSEEGIAALAQSGTVAVLLPGAYYYLRETRKPPIASLRKHQIPVAIATDCNPGTSPILSLLLIMNMACTLFDFTPEEALLAVTRHAAQALGLSQSCGTLAPGKAADFAVWEVQKPVDLVYYLGDAPLSQLVKSANVLINK